jgi:ABC-type multidrug transport system ATPase subunit
VILANTITKRYGKFLANDNISLTAVSGEMTVLLGPNGAGKSTLIKSICGLLRFDGNVTVDGFDNHTTQAKRILGYVPEFPALFPMLTISEHMEFIAKAYRLNNWQTRAQELLEQFELADKTNKLGKELSKGMQQKVSVCCALLPEPKAVIFDEPLVGLDPHGIRELKTVLRDLKSKGHAVLISTHMIETVEDDWDTTYILSGGKVASICRRSELLPGKTLEDIYFSIIEGGEIV